MITETNNINYILRKTTFPFLEANISSYYQLKIEDDHTKASSLSAVLKLSRL